MMPMLIQKQIEIAARATTVWRFIGTEEGLRQWWGLAVTLEAKQGGRCEERIQWQGRPCHLCGQVTVYDPPHQLTLFLRNEDEANGGPTWTTIAITLAEKNGRTQVTLVQQVFSQVAVEPIGVEPVLAPQSWGNRQQPQNWLGATGSAAPGLVNGSVRPLSDSRWLDQQEAHWNERLQTLAQMVEVQMVEKERSE